MIRTRLTAWNCTVLAFILTLTGLAIYFTTSRNVYRGLDDGLIQRAKFFAVSWHGWQNPGDQRFRGPQPGPPPQDTIDADAARREGMDPSQIRQIEIMRSALRPMILGLDGKDVVHPENKVWDLDSFTKAKSGHAAFRTIVQNDVKLRVLSFPLRKEGKVKEIIQLAAPMLAEEQQLDQLGKTLVIVLPLAVVLMLVVGVVLTRFALRPVAQIAEAAEQIEASNLSERLPVLGKDEFAQLSTTFNGLLERLKSAFDEKDEAYARQRRFTADASHELKTPLTAIQARTGIALQRDLAGAEYKEHILAIDRASNSMRSIVQDLLLLAASDEGELRLRPESVNVGEMIDDAISSVDSSQHDFSIQVPHDLIVQVDQSAMTRVLVNLVQNSVLYSEKGKKISISALKESSQCLIEIRDEGEGIPSEHVPIIFERFHRVDKSRDRESGGSGLGLAIAKAIVEAHGGTISLKSDLGQGTTVSITLPS